MKLHTLNLAVVLLVTGCAGINHKTVPLRPTYLLPEKGAAHYKAVERKNALIRAHNQAIDAKLCGLRYYRPAPYLLVYSTGKGTVSWEIHYLPEPATLATAKPYNFLASLSAKLEFTEKGTLSSITEEADSTAVPKAILEAIKTAAEIAAKGVAALVKEGRKEQDHLFPPPQLYKVIVENGVVSFQGGAVEINEIRATPVRN
jgi:hypothetical protein